jgi:regulator of nucleoside diphosphate kinase
LERVACAAAAEGHAVASFLSAELRRAAVTPDGAMKSGTVVCMGASVTYRLLSRGTPAETRTLVYPEEYAAGGRHISVLSPLGAALLGVRPGSRMPYAPIEGFLEVVEVESLARSAPKAMQLTVRAPTRNHSDDARHSSPLARFEQEARSAHGAFSRPRDRPRDGRSAAGNSCGREPVTSRDPNLCSTLNDGACRIGLYLYVLLLAALAASAAAALATAPHWIWPS